MLTNLKTYLQNNWNFFLLLGFLVFVSYTNSLQNDFVSDDIATIKDNPQIANLSYFWPSFTFLRPFVLFIVHKIGGLNTVFYHLLNIFFHLGCVWIIYILINFIHKPPVGIFASSLFAVHPILTESVSWISGGTYPQYSFFLLLSFFFYVLSKENAKSYYFSVFTFILSLLCAERSIVLIGIIFAWEFCMNSLTKNWKKLIPFFILSLIFLTPFLFKIGWRLSSLEAQSGLENSIRNPFLHIPIALTTYFQTIFFPKNISFYYSRNVFSNLEIVLRGLIVVSYFGAIIYYFIRKKRLVSFWLAFFIITLSFTLSPFAVASFIADRYVYLSSLGFFVIAALLFNKLRNIKRLKIAAYIIFSLIVVVLLGRTIRRNIDWRDTESFSRATLKVSPNSSNAMHDLANTYYWKGDIQNAIVLYNEAIKLNPKQSYSYNNLGNAYHKIGKAQEAKANYEKAILINPICFEAYRGLAAIYLEEENHELALENMAKAVKVNPKHALLRTNLGVVYMKLGEKEKAEAEFEKALELNPNEENAKKLLNILPTDTKIVITGGLF